MNKYRICMDCRVNDGDDDDDDDDDDDGGVAIHTVAKTIIAAKTIGTPPAVTVTQEMYYPQCTLSTQSGACSSHIVKGPVKLCAKGHIFCKHCVDVVNCITASIYTTTAAKTDGTAFVPLFASCPACASSLAPDAMTSCKGLDHYLRNSVYSCAKHASMGIHTNKPAHLVYIMQVDASGSDPKRHLLTSICKRIVCFPGTKRRRK
jgi:hypothetical protein